MRRPVLEAGSTPPSLLLSGQASLLTDAATAVGDGNAAAVVFAGLHITRLRVQPVCDEQKKALAYVLDLCNI